MDLEARRRRSQHAFHSVFSPVELDGDVRAIVTPRSPDRSIVNAVAYASPESVVAHYDDLARLYDEGGVRAWTVWVHPGHDELGRALAARGHVLDAMPQAMGGVLADMDLTGPDIGSPIGWGELARLNEVAYGVDPGSFDAVAELPDGAAHLVGMPGRACVGVFDHEGDAWVLFVATHPDARGQGLARALMKQALRAARDRGCTTTTLEASPMGQPVYERLGYAPLGTVQMWEHRVPTPQPAETS